MLIVHKYEDLNHLTKEELMTHDMNKLFQSYWLQKNK